ncbi:3-oxoacyl-[acyl-carrier-protein] synthase 3 protein 2 [Streptomyces sviceus ATCC 29083]|uniref:3-oxoacyl-[acyl-carrier-protein] synthase 3 protein 2 n=1 Tax=Streptomyces sviceus (strain ATCC 29083 / DSM 924 / JCM 4929 / NBRC 13980 / NCIMB 11184 / NRRL 5439 / UC 5370) TaxID=463191 RepID=B5I4V3_STRX2|nr:3-oxoacyl-[acyl-carrier-protein] synthase 3 protein 2 [Streptomyces sviceus ATCC 29083]
MNGSRIAAVGHYQPARVLTNEDLAGLVDTSDEWIRSRVGIRTRHIAGPDEPVDELASHAAAKALAAAGLTPADIDLVLVATSTAVDRSPNMAARVAARLGIPSPAAMDVNVVCAGFTHALATADHTVRAGAATRALVIGADKMSAVTDWSDRTTCVLVGDGAGAAVVEGADVPGISPVLWGSVPEMGHAVRIEGEPARFAQEGQSVYRWATTKLPNWPGRPVNAPGSPPRTSPRSCCTRRTCGSSSRSRRRSARSTPWWPGTSPSPGTRPRPAFPWRSPSWSSRARSRPGTRCCCSGSAGTCPMPGRSSAAPDLRAVARPTRGLPGRCTP